MNRILDNADRVMQTVGDNRQQVADLMQNAATLMRDLATTAPKLDQTVAQLGQVVGAIDPAQLKSVGRQCQHLHDSALANASGTLGNTLHNADELMQTVSDNRQKIADRAAGWFDARQEPGSETAPKLDQAVGSLGRVAGAIDPGEAQRRRRQCGQVHDGALATRAAMSRRRCAMRMP